MLKATTFSPEHTPRDAEEAPLSLSLAHGPSKLPAAPSKQALTLGLASSESPVAHPQSRVSPKLPAGPPMQASASSPSAPSPVSDKIRYKTPHLLPPPGPHLLLPLGPLLPTGRRQPLPCLKPYKAIPNLRPRAHRILSDLRENPNLTNNL